MAKILVVDDEPLVAGALGEILSDAGHDVLFPAAAGDLMAEALGRAYDLLLTDVFLADTSGWDLIRMVRQYRPTTPVVAISGGGSAFQADTVLQISDLIGADATLAKPISGQALLQAIDRALQRAKPN